MRSAKTPEGTRRAKSAAKLSEHLAFNMDRVAAVEFAQVMAASFDGTIVLVATGSVARRLMEVAEDTGLVEFQRVKRKARSPRARKPAPAEDGDTHRSETET